MAGKTRPLVAARFLGHLHHDRLPGANEALDARPAQLFGKLGVADADVPGVEKGVFVKADVDKGGVHAREDVLDAADIDVPRQLFVALALKIQLGQSPVFKEGQARLAAETVDEDRLAHAFFHSISGTFSPAAFSPNRQRRCTRARGASTPAREARPRSKASGLSVSRSVSIKRA